MTPPAPPQCLTSLGKDITPDALPETPFRYLLLMTITLQNWAYRPVPQEGELRPAYAPGVLDLVKEFDSFAHTAWVWRDTSLDDHFDRGPLLVDVTQQPALLQHAITHWAPIGGALVIGSQAELGDVSSHLKGQITLTLPDQGQAILDIRPHHLSAWLEALDEDNRHAWLGPIHTLLWRANWGPVHDWYRLDHQVVPALGIPSGAISLRPHELKQFDANTREYFLLSRVYDVRAMPAHATRSLEEVRRWVEQLLQVADRLNIHDDVDTEQYIRLFARNLWLLHSAEARTALNDLTESPQARLRHLAALVQAKESSHD